MPIGVDFLVILRSEACEVMHELASCRWQSFERLDQLLTRHMSKQGGEREPSRFGDFAIRRQPCVRNEQAKSALNLTELRRQLSAQRRTDQ